MLGGVTGYLLVSKPANAWINRFPLPFSGELIIRSQDARMLGLPAACSAGPVSR